MRATIVGVVLNQAGEDALSASLLIAVLHALFGGVMPADATRRLIAEAERLARAGECAPDDISAVRAALASVSEAIGAQQPRDAQRLITLLLERARTGRSPGAGERSSGSLLERLFEEFPTEAGRLLRAVRESGIRPSALLSEPVPQRLFERSLLVLASGARDSVALLLRILSGLPAADRPGTDGAMRARIVGVLLDQAGENALSSSLLVTALRALLGRAIPQAVGQRLVAETERLARAGESAPDAIAAVRAALASVVESAEGVVSSVSVPGAAAALAWLRASEVSGESTAPSVGPPVGPSAAIRLSSPAADQAPEGERTKDRLSDDAQRHELVELMDAAPEAVLEVLASSLANRDARERWVRVLSERELARVTYLLEPRRHRHLVDATELLFAAWQDVVPELASGVNMRAVLWSFLLEFLSQTRGAERCAEAARRCFLRARRRPSQRRLSRGT